MNERTASIPTWPGYDYTSNCGNSPDPDPTTAFRENQPCVYNRRELVDLRPINELKIRFWDRIVHWSTVVESGGPTTISTTVSDYPKSI